MVESVLEPKYVLALSRKEHVHLSQLKSELRLLRKKPYAENRSISSMLLELGVSRLYFQSEVCLNIMQDKMSKK